MHAEIRGRGSHWKVWVPDAGQMVSTAPVYDEDGILVRMLRVGSPPTDEGIKYVETFGGPFASIEEATDYARYLGFTEAKISHTQTKEQALAKARAARGR